MDFETFKRRKREGSLPHFVETEGGLLAYITPAGAMRRARRIIRQRRAGA